MEFFEDFAFNIEMGYYRLVEEHSDPKLDETLDLAMRYRFGDDRAGQKFEKRLTTRSPRYLEILIKHARDNRPNTLDALANGVSLFNDEPISKDDLLKLVNS